MLSICFTRSWSPTNSWWLQYIFWIGIWSYFQALTLDIYLHKHNVRKSSSQHSAHLSCDFFMQRSFVNFLDGFSFSPLRLYFSKKKIPRQHECQVSKCLRSDGLVRAGNPQRGHVLIFWSASMENSPSGLGPQRKHCSSTKLFGNKSFKNVFILSILIKLEEYISVKLKNCMCVCVSEPSTSLHAHDKMHDFII